MERILNKTFASVFALLTAASLYFAIFYGAHHQYFIAALTATMSITLFSAAKTAKP